MEVNTTTKIQNIIIILKSPMIDKYAHVKTDATPLARDPGKF
jgi:hypothetical protein